MIAKLLLTGGLLAGGGAQEASFVDASLELEGELFGLAVVDIDADGRDELCLAVKNASGERELRLHRIEGTRIPPEPFQVVPVLADTLAYGFADVRSEPGRELFFLTRDGAWSYSLTKEGYRGNVRRLLETELVYDVPDPDELPRWRYVLPGQDGDRLLLPARDGFIVWGPDPSTDAEAYRPENSFAARAAGPRALRRRSEERTREDRTEVRLGPGGIQISRDTQTLGGRLLPDDVASDKGDLLEVDVAYGAPAMIDVDGNGSRDLLVLVDDELLVYLAGADGAIPTGPTRSEPLPAYLARKGTHDDDEQRRVFLRFADLDGDGDQDLLAQDEVDADSFENGQVSLSVLLNDGERLLPDAPDQILRFEAAELRVHVTDVDGDGRPDLAVRKFELPSFLDVATGLEFTLTQLLYLGENKGARPFARKPALKHTQTFDENTLGEAIKNRELELDCSGDGIADLVEVDYQGRIAIRRLLLEDGFFSGPAWSLEEAPWLRFDAFGNIGSIEVIDLNGDGLGDIVSGGSRAITVLLSQRPGKKRP